MDYRSLWKRWFRLPSSQPGRGPARTRPRLEELEPRLVLSPLTGAPDPSSGQPPSPFQAAVTLFFDGTQLIANQVTLQPQNAVLASIAANSPSAGPLAPVFVAAGAGAEFQFLQSAVVSLAHALAEFPGSPGAI
jgi:hypothetical protein